MKKAILFLVILLSAPTWMSPATAGSFVNEPVMLEAQEAEAPKICTITIRGKIGETNVDVQVTVEADNCAVAAADLLKQYAKK